MEKLSQTRLNLLQYLRKTKTLCKLEMLSTLTHREWIGELQRYWELMEVLVSRNLKVRYRGSFLGAYWSLLNPLIMTLLYTAIFGSAFKTHYGSVQNYILAVFTGLIVFNFFSASTMQALVSVVGNSALLNKVNLPTSIFPVSMIAANVFQLLIGTLPLLAIITCLNSFSLVNILSLFFPCLALTLFSTGVGFFVSALYVFFRDLSYFYELLLFVIWIGCPVFYPVDIVPDHIKPILKVNPLSLIIESIRQISLTNAFPDFDLIWKAILGGSIVLGLGWVFFQWSRPKFMDLL